MPYTPPPIIPSGRPFVGVTTYFSLPGVVPLGTVALAGQAANFVRYFPIITQTPLVIDQLNCEVTTAAAGGKLLRMGMYNCDINWQPTSLIVDSGALAADTAAPFVASASVSVKIGPGRYLLAWNTDGAPTVRVVRGSVANAILVPALGASPLLISLRGTQTFGAFPGTGTAIDSAPGNTTGFDYWVFPRISVP